METTKLIVLLIGILVTAVPARSAEKQATEVSDTLIASCLVKITFDPTVLPLDDVVIEYLLHSSGVVGRAARDVRGILPEEARELYRVDFLPFESARDISPESVRSRIRSELELDDMMPDEIEEESDDVRSRSRIDGRDSRLERRRTERTSELYGLYGQEATRMPRRPRSTISTPLGYAAEQMNLFQLSIALPEDAKPVAEEFMNALIDNLRSALTKAFDEHMLRLRNQFDLAEAEAIRTESELRELQTKLREISGSRILDRNRILRNIMDLRGDLQNTMMEQGSDKVILDTITQRIAETQTRLKEQVTKDDVTRELQRIVELQMQEVRRAQELIKSGGDMHQDVLEEAERKLARAKIELAQRREQLNKTAGGNLIESLNRELADRSMQTAQSQAKIASLMSQLAEAEELLNKADDHELLSLKADITKNNLQEAIVWRDRMSRQIRLIQPPMISVLGGK